jgi:hypothetical protein
MFYNIIKTPLYYVLINPDNLFSKEISFSTGSNAMGLILKTKDAQKSHRNFTRTE